MIKTSTGQKIGLWQDPSQFAAAMAYHGSSRHEIRSYIEVSLCIDLSLSLPRPRPRPSQALALALTLTLTLTLTPSLTRWAATRAGRH